MPISHFELVGRINGFAPARVFCPERFVDALSPAVAQAGFASRPVAFSSLSHASLVEHWQAVADVFDVPLPADVPRAVVRRLDLAGVSIPLRQLSRTLGDVDADLDDPAGLSDAMWDLLGRRAQLQPLGRLGLDDVRKVKFSRGDVLKHLAQARLPVTLVAPGIATRYARRGYTHEQIASVGEFAQFNPHDVWTATARDGHEAAERSALEFGSPLRGVPGRCRADTSAVPAEAWNLLNMPARHLVDSDGDGKPWKVTDLLGRLDSASAPLWSGHVLHALKGAPSVRVLSNFPLGLLTPPGHEVPIASLAGSDAHACRDPG